MPFNMGYYYNQTFVATNISEYTSDPRVKI